MIQPARNFLHWICRRQVFFGRRQSFCSLRRTWGATPVCDIVYRGFPEGSRFQNQKLRMSLVFFPFWPPDSKMFDIQSWGSRLASGYLTTPRGDICDLMQFIYPKFGKSKICCIFCMFLANWYIDWEKCGAAGPLWQRGENRHANFGDRSHQLMESASFKLQKLRAKIMLLVVPGFSGDKEHSRHGL